MTTQSLPPLPVARSCPFDPPAEYRRFRFESPVTKIRTPRGDPAWVVTRLEDVREVLNDRRFSSDPRKPGFPSYLTGDVPPPPGFFMQTDAPEHTRLRRTVTKEFLTRHVEALRPKMQSVVDAFVDRLTSLEPPADFVGAFAVPVAAAIICELLGVPCEDHPFIQDRTDTVLNRSSTPEQTQTAAIELMGYFDRVITRKEGESSDDLLGRLVAQAKHEGQPSHQELVGIAALLLLGGYDTMAQVIGLGVVTLLRHPDQLERFLADASLGEGLCDELVRYLSVNHAGLPRVATQDVELGGQQIRAGEGVLVMVNSANRDEAVFGNPDAFDIHRQCRHHVGFGHGIHKCIGANFARAELEIVFRTLFTRLPSVHLAAPLEELAFRHEMVLYGLHKLPVAW